MISLDMACPGSNSSFLILLIAVSESEKIVRDVYSFFLFSFIATLKAFKTANNSASQISFK